MATPEFTPQDVAAGATELLPEIAPIHPLRMLRRGRSHVSWLLESVRGYLVGKVLLGNLRDGDTERLAEHRRVWEHGVPVPPILAFTDSCASVAGQPFTVFEYLVGMDAEEALPLLDTAMVLDLMHDTGLTLARLHKVPVRGFGDAMTGLGATSGNWSTVVSNRAEALQDAYRSIDDVPATLVQAGLDLLCQLAEEVSPVTQPAVTHSDVYLPNVLLDEDGSFHALLDLEHLRWSDPVMDFIKPAMWIFPDRPDWAEAFMHGYRTGGHWPTSWSERLAVATGMELLTGVEYWTRVADPTMRDDYSRRLRTWVRSDGVDHVWSAINPATLRA